MSIRSARHLSIVAVPVILLLACLSSVNVRAQNISTAQLNGTVHDPSGAVVPGAVITIEDVSKGFSRTTTSDGEGNYQMVLLPPGTYTVTVTSPGFNKLVEPNVILTIGEQAHLPLSLPIGATDQVVT
ncbi:MAG TPA: carboxypeptidase-like regulatory domain-containing protein, partial [Acidobacteriaceae bacterium]